MVMNRKIDNDWTNDGTTVPKEKKQKEPKTPADVQKSKMPKKSLKEKAKGLFKKKKADAKEKKQVVESRTAQLLGGAD